MNYAAAQIQSLDNLSAVPKKDAASQNLPNLQKASLRAPENIKIDGSPIEWGNFQAYNHNTDILYAIANDDQNLYVAVKAIDPDIINKIIAGGAEFVISRSGKKKAKDNVHIGYPVVENKAAPTSFNLWKPKGTIPDTSANEVNLIMNKNNAIMQQNFKSIYVSGISGADTLSIYNEKGIKAAGAFDLKKTYTFELAIPLSYLGLSIDNAQKFAYSINLNVSDYAPRSNIILSPPPGASDEYRAGYEAGLQNVNIKYSKTDFWGDYTLIKK